MKDMSMSKAEAEKACSVMSPEKDKPKYPYGLCLHLDNETLKKLGYQNLPDIGTKVKIEAVGEVKSISASDSQEGGSHKSVDIQITEMEVSAGGEKNEKAAEELYG